MQNRINSETEALASKVIGAAIEVHKELGPGLPEVAYENALAKEFVRRNIPFERQKCVEILYKGEPVGECRLDYFVSGELVVELKAIEALADIHTGQVISYLRITNKRLGLLVNFNVMLLKDGIKRVAL